MIENIQSSTGENGVSVNEILQDTIQLFLDFREEIPLTARYSESIKFKLSEVIRLTREINKEFISKF